MFGVAWPRKTGNGKKARTIRIPKQGPRLPIPENPKRKAQKMKEETIVRQAILQTMVPVVDFVSCFNCQ